MSRPLAFSLQPLNEEGSRAGTLQQQVCPGSWVTITVLLLLGGLEGRNGNNVPVWIFELFVCALMASFFQFLLLEFSKPNKNSPWSNIGFNCAAFIITQCLSTITSCSSSCLLLCLENPPRHWRPWKEWRGNWRQPPPRRSPQWKEWGTYRTVWHHSCNQPQPFGVRPKDLE